MSPLSLYIEQINFHGPLYSPCQHPQVSVYPISPPTNQIFDSLHSAPALDKTRTNRVLTYPGSFNPPHRGHLHLLKHVFTRGTHDLNVIAAIILPRSDESLAQKVKEEDGKFMFGIDERSLLWKQDLCFPPWAWVYNGSQTSFTKYSERLIQATKKDGYLLEFVPLYGAGIASPSSPPDPVYGCKILIMSDAARASEYQHYSGRLVDFDGCTRWKGIGIDKNRLRQYANVKASRASMATQTICPLEACCMLNDCDNFVETATETSFARAVEELKAVVTCKRQLSDRTLTLRFVKCENVNPWADYNDISSTTVREIMRSKKGVKLKEALDWMALSSDVLWRYKASWIDKARLGKGCCIKFEELPELPMSYPEPPHFDDPPSLDVLGLLEPSEPSPSTEEVPSLESPGLQEDSPVIEEPQQLVEFQQLHEPPPTNTKKRRFSETGLEDDVKILGDSAEGGLLVAEDAEMQKPESCHF